MTESDETYEAERAAGSREQRELLRDLWRALEFQEIAAVGPAQGIVVRNRLGEKFVFQVDRDAWRAFTRALNGKLS